jgi:hypothetical protein
MEHFEQILLKSDQSSIFDAAIKRREDISAKIIRDVWANLGEIEQWQALRYLIGKCNRKEKSGCYSEQLFDELQSVSIEIVTMKNEIDKLQKNQALVIEAENKKEFCLTEDFPLSFIPKNVENSIKTTLNIDHTSLDQWSGETKNKHAETVQTQVLALEPASGMVKSEKINRQLKNSSNDRIFPQLNGSEKSKKFVDMTSALLDGLLIYAWKTIGDNSVVEASKSTICSFGRFSKFSADDINWYLDAMKEFVVSANGPDMLYLPFATIQMLLLSVYKWSGLPQVGKELNFIGKMVEDLIFNLVQSYDGETLHPVTKEPLVRVIDPTTKEEIADIIIFNSKSILIIESKFWDCPHLSDLEEQLDIFKKKVDYFFINRKRFGFPEADVFPVFYTPFPPYSSWQGIQLIPSQFLVGWYVGEFFKPKKPNLFDENEKLKKLVASEDYPIPYPLDCNELDVTIPANAVRINDGWVVEYNEHEISLKVMNPIGEPIVVILDITANTFSELTALNIDPGDFLRFGCINHSGSWSITQFLYFKKLDEKDPKRKIRELLGNTDVANEVISVFEAHKLDIFQFIEFCKSRTPTLSLLNEVVAARLGSVLNTCNMFDFVTQCKCGNVLGLQSSMVEQWRALCGGEILCSACLKKNSTNYR